MVTPLVLALCAACASSGSSGDSQSVGDHLTVTSVGKTDHKCEGTFAPGESVQVTDSRFAPAADVTLTISPIGVAAQSSHLFADGAGAISSTIQLPQTGDSVYISAVGVGISGAQVNDTVGLDLLPANTACKD